MSYGDLSFIPCIDIICATITTMHTAECDSSLCCQSITFQSIKLLEDLKIISGCSFLCFMLSHSQTSWKSIALIIYTYRLKCSNICSSDLEAWKSWHILILCPQKWMNDMKRKSKVPCVNMRSVTP